jgi:uncharacterized SAM-binding protein YcdF (DUF218 family)
MEPDLFFLVKKWIALFTDPLTLICLLTLVFAISFKLLPLKFKKHRYKAFLFCFVLLWALSTPLLSGFLMKPIETRALIDLYDGEGDADAIVVLGCGHTENEALPLSSRYQSCSMMRVIHAIHLHNNHDLPIYFSGGVMPGKRESEAGFNATLALSLGVASESINVIEGAVDTASESVTLKHALQNFKVVLVTSASHMWRARRYLEREGLDSYASPTDFINRVQGSGVGSYYAYLPRWRGLRRSSKAIYEYLALTSQSLWE